MSDPESQAADARTADAGATGARTTGGDASGGAPVTGPAAAGSAGGGAATDRLPVWFQRTENLAVAMLAVVAFVSLRFDWWWLLVLFLAFDLSMVGYLKDARLGAWTYNSVHSYIGPAVLGVVVLVTDARWAAFLALAWAFHIAVDRALGYGLKLTDHFGHTHLGRVGRGH